MERGRGKYELLHNNVLDPGASQGGAEGVEEFAVLGNDDEAVGAVRGAKVEDEIAQLGDDES